ncbi:MAG: 2-C-methyl-D-erythritol 2,4-cyclodiphosphate synthase [Acidimicrobiia bacterium]|nr:2-C-methyl-D-erythritol 2,4-cyclodiphosphate synthase [Acidimicrobiia bacterium]MYC57038.1 2-C-methyl-D-erythritol 2,4-cyclodiphosphate synthase [Acidimicrobiia bacterium]MYG93545.1 2-C-methyl-D-erythritol 2,4-cyclodiphosphate synthase [Acidimicrobiia bacterium]MYI31107.1 2-C-methyl-D-erythritol 2,4-cyclodiphosphate synthase [Acidimicrobiia bacterium]
MPEGSLQDFRVGHGFDTHRFSEDVTKKLILGGVRFDSGPGLVGHSDADALVHAVIDALLSCAGLGDIGAMFPETDEAWAGANSMDLLAKAIARLNQEGWVVVNVDCTVVTEAPRIAPRRQEIEELLSEAVGAPVMVKGKRAEGLGALGRCEGLACWAVALITRQRS